MNTIFTVLIVIVVVVAGVIYFSDSGFIISRNTEIEQANFLSSDKPLSNLGKAPELAGIVGWINSEPFTLESLRGKVVLLDFWTYTCINCIRTFPHISAWYEKYKDNGFVLLGVHTPEFDFEKSKENVLAAVQKYNLKYPVAQDNDYATWNAYNNRYWPAHYLIDAEGNIRYTHFGEGKYAETESAIQQLLLEAGLLTIDKVTEAKEPTASVEFSKIGTPEIYLGYLRINNLGNKEMSAKLNEPFTFSEPKKIEDNRFYFVGKWNIMPEHAELVGENGKLIIRYKANKVNMVLSSETEISLVIKLDGKDQGTITVKKPLLYNLTDTGDEYDWHTLEIIIPSPGLKAFTFTFG